MECPGCGDTADDHGRYCSHCGAFLRVTCPRCGAENASTASLCATCHESLDAQPNLVDQSPQLPSAPRPLERRQLTIMFCDLVNSTELAERMDPEDFGVLIEAHRTACVEPIKRYGGVVARYLGDGILVYFGYPEAHEEDPDRAVRAGLDIVAATKALNADWSGVGHGEIAVRIGIHTGIVVVGDVHKQDVSEPMAVFGDVPALAARLQGLAQPNSVVVSEQTRSLVSGGIRCKSRGQTKVKGVSQPISAFEVVDAGGDSVEGNGAPDRPLPFVNREHELEKIEGCWTAAQEGRGRAILLSGDPGIGKSRIIMAIQERLGAESCCWFAARTSPYAKNSDFFAFAEMFHKLLHPAQESRFNPTGYNLLQQVLEESGIADRNVALGFAALLGLEVPDSELSMGAQPERIRELIFKALTKWLCVQAEKQLVVLIIEDLHWADASTLEAIQVILANLETRRFLLILSSRDESVISVAPGQLERLRLDRLQPNHAQNLLQHVLSGTQLPKVAIGTLLERADGVPLFIEELPKPLLELRRQSDGIANGDSSFAAAEPMAIPATLRDSLMAQLDRMGRAKVIAQIAAVLGHSFEFALLRQVWSGDEQVLIGGVKTLTDASVLVQRGTLPEAHLEFKHALIAETAYDSLLRQERRRHHLQAAKALVAHFPTVVEGRPELIARHYAAAGEGIPAFEAWLSAGKAAARRSANTEAIGHMRSAEAELVKQQKAEDENLDDRWLALHKARGPVLIAILGWAAPEVEKTFRQVLTLSASLRAGPRDQFDAWAGLCNVFLVRGDLVRARDAADRMHEIAGEEGSKDLMLRWHRIVGLCEFLAGCFAAATDHNQQAIALNELNQQIRLTIQRGINPDVIAHSIRAWSCWFLGHSKAADRACSASIKSAERAEHPFSLCYALCIASSLEQCRGRATDALSRAETAFDLSIEYGFPYWRAWASIVKGWALGNLGDVDAGLIILQDGIARYEATGALQMKGYSLCLLAETYQRAGRWQNVVDAAEAAIAETEHTGIVFYQAEAYRLKGEGMFALGGAKARPIRLLTRAMRTAEQQRSLPLLLKATCSLLLHADGERLHSKILARANGLLTELKSHYPASELVIARRRLAEAVAAKDVEIRL